MALIKLGALAQDVRGSLNGTTFSRNRGGAYVRSKVSPVQPVSPYSANSRQAFKIVSQTWASLLTAADRAAWIAFAALHPFVNVFGDSILLSGVAFYGAAMKRLQQLGFPIFDSPGATWDVDPPGVIAPILSVDGAGNVSLLIQPVNAPSGGTITAYLFATPVLAPGVRPQKSDFRLINSIDGTIRDDTFDFGAAYKARFNGLVPNVGDKVAFLYAYLDTDTGALSVPSQLDTLAVGLPGPSIPVSIIEGADATGGQITQYFYCDIAHGLTTGDLVNGAGFTDTDFNVSSVAVTVDSPTVFHRTATIAGSVFAPTADSGVIHRVG